MAKELDAWAAGFLDGEGTFYLSQDSKGRYLIRIQAAQISPAPLERLQVLFGGKVKQITAPSVVGKNRKPIWEWRVQSAVNVGPILDRIAPYSVTKSREIDLMKEFCETFGNGYQRQTDEIKLFRSALIAQLRLLRS